MIQNDEFLDSVSFLMFAFTLYFMSSISKRLGSVMGLKKYYYLYYLGILLILFASIISFFSSITGNNQHLGYLPFSAGLTFSLFASIKYWSWLIKELLRG